MKVSILNVNKAMVLMALYNASKMQGMSFLGGDGAQMTLARAEEEIKESLSFDYLNGKVMKVDLSKNTVDLWLYDRDNGAGAGLKAINSVSPESHVVTDEEAENINRKVTEVVFNDLEYTEADKE